jgi:hypothetical protein
MTLTVFFAVVETFFQRSTLRLPSRWMRIASWVAAVKGDPGSMEGV